MVQFIMWLCVRVQLAASPFAKYHYIPFIQLPLNGFHFNVLPFISDNVIRLPFIREPSSSVNKTISRKNPIHLRCFGHFIMLSQMKILQRKIYYLAIVRLSKTLLILKRLQWPKEQWICHANFADSAMRRPIPETKQHTRTKQTQQITFRIRVGGEATKN